MVYWSGKCEDELTSTQQTATNTINSSLPDEQDRYSVYFSRTHKHAYVLYIDSILPTVNI